MARQVTVATPTRPHQITIDTSTGKIIVSHPAGDTSLGAAVNIEAQNPANADAIYTVPANKTFTGRILVLLSPQGSGSSASLGASAATGGVQAQATVAVPSGGSAPSTVDAVDVSIAGGGGGNAITATVSGGATGSVLLVGYVK